ncbi:MAG: hypothetical protein BGO39_09650 [Chloroflexi bacterium 54-19]|nr:MAG: hypothetical protein BGO39_09650 [Chloroflexi bacterium 54-19]
MLTHPEIKKIIQTLAEWKAISSQEQANELLTQFELKANIFSDEEWDRFPLNELEKTEPASTLPLVWTPPSLTTCKTTSPYDSFRFNNLPVQLTSLVGREPEVARIGHLLGCTTNRLLSLIGPGGCGKTRLAVEVGRVYNCNFKQGVCFVDLSEVNETPWVGTTIAKALGLNLTTITNPVQILKEFLRDQQVLLILDNFEHITGASGLLEELLKAAPGVKIMVTTRVVLHLYGEQEFAVPPLDLPGPDEPVDNFNYSKFDAIRLFVERARGVKPDFEVDSENATSLAKICSLLNGIPLALELAATRVKVLSLPVLLERLTTQKLDVLNNGAHNLPHRHKTLRNTLEWSFYLLNPDGQQLFRGLGIFRGSFSLEAVNYVVGKVLEKPTYEDKFALDGLGDLLDNSLIIRSEFNKTAFGFDLPAGNLVSSSRFRLLETLREYAFEQLTKNKEVTRLRVAHFQYYLELVEKASKQLNGPDQNLWLAFLDSEYPNIRTALEMGPSFLETEEVVPGGRDRIILDGLKMCHSLSVYWDIRGYYAEGKLITSHFLEAARQADLTRTVEYAWGLCYLGIWTGRLGDFALAEEGLIASLGLFERLEEKSGQITVLTFLGSFVQLLGNDSKALGLFSQAEELCLQTNDKNSLGNVLINTAILLKTKGQFEPAVDRLHQALAIFQEEGNRRLIATCLHNLGATALNQRKISFALDYLNQCLQIRLEQADYHNLAYDYRMLAVAAYFQHDYVTSQNHLLESLRYSYRIGDKYQIGMDLALLAILYVAEFELYLASAENLLDESKQNLYTAARLMGTSAVQLNLAGTALNPVYQNIYEEKYRKVQTLLGEAEFNANYTIGLTSPLNVTLESFLTLLK